MSEYVEPSPVVRQLFFLAMLLLVGAYGVLAVWMPERYQSPQDHATVEEVVSDAKAASKKEALGITIGSSPFVALFIWGGARLIRERRWPLEGMPVPFKTKIRHYTKLQAWALALLIVTVPLLHVCVAWWADYKRTQFFESIAQEISRN